MISPAPAKINLCLFVGGMRAADGRHEVVSIMQSVDLCDEVELTAAEADSLDVGGETQAMRRERDLDPGARVARIRQRQSRAARCGCGTALESSPMKSASRSS